MFNIELSIIYPVKGGKDMTEVSLQYLADSDVPEDTELIFIDDNLDTNTVYDLTILPKTWTVPVVWSGGKGFGPACNTGILNACGNHIAIFNNDMYVPIDWYQSLKTELERNTVKIYEVQAKIGMISGGLAEPPYELMQWIDSFHDWHHPEPTTQWFHKGGPWLFRKEFFEEVGIFDEQFVPGFWEEMDLLYRGAQKGWTFGITNAIVTYHESSATMLRDWTQEEKNQIVQRNQQKFIQKWGTATIPWYEALRESVNG